MKNAKAKAFAPKFRISTGDNILEEVSKKDCEGAGPHDLSDRLHFPLNLESGSRDNNKSRAWQICRERS
jgi:hypothetical protein